MAIRTAVIVGAGTVGTTLALLLRQKGVDVDLVEKRPDLGTLGSGVLLHGNGLRVLAEAGVVKQALAAGSEIGQIGIATPAGEIVAVQEDLRSGGPDLPATLGIPRPVLHGILINAVRTAGVRLHAGVHVSRVHQDEDGAEAETAGGQRLRGDVVVLTAGAHGDVRDAVTTHRPELTGWGAWRALMPRPAGVQARTVLAYGGPAWIAGYAPMGPDLAYAVLVTTAPATGTVARENHTSSMLDLASAYGGPVWQDIRERLGAAEIHFTPFEKLLADHWYRGRVALAGDSAHCFVPTLAQGAAMGLEDASVLAEVLTGEAPVPTAMKEYEGRRQGRVRTVVGASDHLALLLAQGRQHEAPEVIGKALFQLVARP